MKTETQVADLSKTENQSAVSIIQEMQKIASTAPEARKRWGRVCREVSEEHGSADALTADFHVPELWGEFLLSQPPSLWYFAIEALENLYGEAE